MSDVSKKEVALRKINIMTEKPVSVSMGINSSFGMLQDINTQSQALHLDTHVSSPISATMPKEGDFVMPSAQIGDKEMEKAYAAVGIKLSSNKAKHAEKVKDSLIKRNKQIDLVGMHRQLVHDLDARDQDWDQYQQQHSILEHQLAAANGIHQTTITQSALVALEKPQLARQDRAFNLYKKIGIADLDGYYLKKDENETVFDLLFRQYDIVKNMALTLPDYERAIERKLNDPAITQQTKDELYVEKAKLMTLQDISAHFAVVEKIMSNKYYSFLPVEELWELSYSEMMKRLKDLYKVPANNQPPQPVRDNELIDFYQNIIRLKQIGFESGDTASERYNSYHKAIVEGEEIRQKRLNPAPAPQPPAQPPAPYTDEEKKTMVEQMTHMGEALDALDEYNRTTLVDVNTNFTLFFKANSKMMDEFQTRYPAAEFQDLPLVIRKLYPFRTQFLAGLNPPGTITAFPADAMQTEIWKNKTDKDDPITPQFGSDAGISVSEEQLGWLDELDGIVLNQALRENIGQQAFALGLLKARPEQRLLVYYLFENKIQDKPIGADFFTAIHNYKPNIDYFRGRLRYDANKWGDISRATRASMAIDPELKQYASLCTDIDACNATIANESTPVVAASITPVQKIKNRLDAIVKRGSLMKMLYRNAEMSEEMPPDMTADPVLRARLFEEYRSIFALLQEIHVILSDMPGGGSMQNQNPANYDDTGAAAAGMQLGAENQSQHIEKTAPEDGGMMWVARKLDEIFFKDTIGLITKAVSSGGSAFEFSGNIFYGSFAGVALGTGAVFGSMLVVSDIVNLAKGYEGMTKADVATQIINMPGDLLGAASGASLAVASLSKSIAASDAFIESIKAGKTVADAAPYIDMTHLFDFSTTAGAAVSVAGALGVAAGAIKTTASIVQAAKVHSQKKDAESAANILGQKNNMALSKNEKVVKRFLSHEKKELNRNGASAAVGIVSGIVTMISGALVMTGALAPIGAIVGGLNLVGNIAFKLAYDRRKKKKNRLQAVDEYLYLDDKISDIRRDATLNQQLANYSDEQIREAVRKEALASLGFSHPEECFRHICMQFAEVIYHGAFFDQGLSQNDQKMYEDAIKSTGLQVNDVNQVRAGNLEPKPSVEAIYLKLIR